MSAPAATWIADRAHVACGGDEVVELRQLQAEHGSRTRRGAKRSRAALAWRFYVGICASCRAPRLLAYPPREQLALDLGARATAAAGAGGQPTTEG